MAGLFQQFLQGATNGFLERPNLRDFTHASKTFTSTAYSNAPKFKWLFHVYFDINKDGVAGTLRDKIFPSTTNYGLLVKTADLPKYGFDLVELNQYNRKRYIQTRVRYDPIRITFHDDNANQIRQLWYNYLGYYYNDPNQPNDSGFNFGNNDPKYAASVLNQKDVYNSILRTNQLNWGYTGEISSANQRVLENSEAPNFNFTKVPFFRAIRIYGFNQHNFALYQLINPIIDSFTHDTYNYAETSATMECTMTLKYESVKYYDGALNGRKPGEIIEGFGDPGVYDRTLSPISLPGTNGSILGRNGLLDSAEGVIEDIAAGNYLSALQTAGRLGRTFKNSRSVLNTAKKELVSGVVNAISNPNTARTGVNFPGYGSNTGPTGQQANQTNTSPNRLSGGLTSPPPVVF